MAAAFFGTNDLSKYLRFIGRADNGNGSMARQPVARRGIAIWSRRGRCCLGWQSNSALLPIAMALAMARCNYATDDRSLHAVGNQFVTVSLW